MSDENDQGNEIPALATYTNTELLMEINKRFDILIFAGYRCNGLQADHDDMCFDVKGGPQLRLGLAYEMSMRAKAEIANGVRGDYLDE